MVQLFKLSRAQKLYAIIAISFCFFLSEISVGFYTKSLALVADAFHYLNDLISFIVALVALKASERDHAPPALSFGWQRATLLGAFFNGVFLLALGVSIFLQAIERFTAIEKVHNPKLVLILGCVGLVLNVVSVTILHEHEHDVEIAAQADPRSRAPSETLSSTNVASAHDEHRHEQKNLAETENGHDLGILGVLVHIAGDAVNNMGVIVAGAIVWKTNSSGRYYADPAVGVVIALMIFVSSIPLGWHQYDCIARKPANQASSEEEWPDPTAERIAGRKSG